MRLSILCTSQRLYGEISHHLYKNLTVDIDISPLYVRHAWVDVTIKKLGSKWKFVDKKEARKCRFHHFPYHKVDMNVNLYAPNPRDPAQLVLLWYKINYLIRFLRLAQSSKNMRIYLQKGLGLRVLMTGTAVVMQYTVWQRSARLTVSLHSCPFAVYKIPDV